MASLKETIRAALGEDPALAALVGDRMYPGGIPDEEPEGKWLYYEIPEEAPVDDLDDEGDLRGEYIFHCFADDFATANAIVDAVKAVLNTYQGGQITRAFWLGTTTAADDVGHEHVVRFDVWGSDAVVVVEAGARARITTGFNHVTLTAGESTLTLDTDGLTLNGEEIEGGGAVTGNTLWVDAVAGDDATAQPDRADKPYRTLAAAKTAAAAGDTIHVRPGSYTATDSLPKSGVGWDFDVGASVSRSGDSFAGIFDDGGAAAAFTVSGAADLSRTLTGASFSASEVVAVGHADSDVVVVCRSIAAAVSGSTISTVYAVALTAGRLSVTADRITAAGGAGGSGMFANTAWWQNGLMSVTARSVTVTGTGSAVYADCNAAPTGDMYVQADEIVGGNPIYVAGSNSVAAAWVRALVVECNNADNSAVLYSGANRLYVQAQKVFGSIRADIGSGLLYVQAQKHSAIGDGTGGRVGLLSVEAGAAVNAIIDVQDADPVGFTGDMLKVAGGTVEVRGMRYSANAGSKGFEVTGGTLRLIDCLIDTSANSSTNPITKSGGTLTLVNCTLIAHATRNCIEASSAQSINVRGSLALNRPVHANVTLASDAPQVFPGLIANQPTYYTGSALASMAAVTYAAAGDLVTIRSNAATDTPLSIRTHASQSANSFELVRDSDSQVGVKTFGHSGLQVKTNLIIGSSDALADDGNPRFFFYNGTTPKVLITNTFNEYASDVPIRWDNSTTVTGAVDLELIRETASVLSVSDAASTGNPAVVLRARSTTTSNRERFRVATVAVDNTDATRKYRAVFTVYDTAAREFMRGEASGTAPMVGFLGAAAIARPAVTGSRGGNAALASLLTALANLGLITDSTTA